MMLSKSFEKYLLSMTIRQWHDKCHNPIIVLAKVVRLAHDNKITTPNAYNIALDLDKNLNPCDDNLYDTVCEMLDGRYNV